MRRKSAHTRSRPGERAAGLKIARFADRHPGWVIGSLLVVTALLAWPMLFWTSSETASQSPRTEITAAQDLVSERFADDVLRQLLLVESRTGNMLDRDPLLELMINSAAMRQDPQISPLLVQLRDPSLGIDIDGIWTIADSVDRLLRQVDVAGGLAAATEQQVDDAVAVLLGGSDPLDWGLASQATADDSGVWSSPALFVAVVADNQQLGGGAFLVTIGADDLRKEEFARTLRDSLRGDGSVLAVWAPAADVNLTSNEQGELAGPYIGATIAVVLLIVGIAFRSYWAVAVAGGALAMLIVWLRGGANLIGLENDQILSTILPISMISFGIDSAFHGIGRVREERRKGLEARPGFVVGLGAVFGALALAASSDAAAFLANVSAPIESVAQFGVAAALATVAAFVLLGVGTPLVLSRIEQRTGDGTITPWVRGDMLLSLLAAAMATGTVLMLVFVSTEIGLAALGAYLVVAVALPALAGGRRKSADSRLPRSGSSARRLGRVVGAVAGKPMVTVGIAGVITASALWFALQLEATFDVKDFFSPDADFVVGLDKTAEYLGDQGGEPAAVFVESDLSSPQVVDAIRGLQEQVAADGGPLARGADGQVRTGRGLIDLIDDLGGSFADPEGAAAAFEAAAASGVVDSSGVLIWSPNDVGTVLWQGPGPGEYATVINYQVPDTRDQVNVAATRALLEPLAEDLEATLRTVDPDAVVVVTGSAVYRDDQLAAIRRAMLLALPIALIACFGIAVLFMRSLRYSLISIIPIVLVVVWLFGIMYLAGHSINVVTAIIGAVSIGIGVDFSTHFVMRFLEEFGSGLRKMDAVAAAGAGTGSALAGSAVTSVAGFGILAFAPMPMFATYGLLTAVMIVLALLAALFVLPSILVLATRDSAVPEHRVAGRVVDLRHGALPAIKIGLGRDLSDAVVDGLLDAIEGKLRGGDVTVRTVPGAALAGLVAEGQIDLAVAVRWPGGTLGDLSQLEVLPLAMEELVVVGGPQSADHRAAVADIANRLIVAGPQPEFEEGILRLLGGETEMPLLAHTVADVLTGLRIAAITGGVMVLPRSMATSGAMSVQTFDPPVLVETVLLATAERTSEEEIFNVVLALHEAMATSIEVSASQPAG